MARPLIVGMCDPSGTEPLGIDDVPRGAAGHRLWRMSGLSREEWLTSFERINVWHGRKWRPVRARLAGGMLRQRIGVRTCVVLGRDAWLALGLPVGFGPADACGNFYFVPHPSGRNLWYNSPDNCELIGRLLRRLAARE